MSDHPTILIVDDEADVRSSFRRVLRLDHYEVEEVGSLKAMLALEHLSDFECIILDRKLPDGTADDVLAELKVRAPQTDVLVVTGHTDLEGTLAALRHGAEDYLLKPVNPDELRASLRRLAQMREMKSALLESEARHRGILETAPTGILTLDEENVIESVNPAIEAISGYQASELIGEPMTLLLAPAHQKNWPPQMVAIPTGPSAATGGHELMARHQSGRTFPISVTLGQVKLPDRNLTTVILEDITGRKQLERDVLRVSEEEKHRIAQDLHDGLASHLTGVSLICKMLVDGEEGPHTATVNQISDLIEEGVQQARRVARGLYPVEDRPEALMDALGNFTAQLRTDLKLDCRFDCPVPVLIRDNAVATHLYRIVQEAANNALRHAKAEQIVVKLSQSAGELTLRIIDNGTGIDGVEAHESNGIGLRTMAYRAGLLQGILRIRPAKEGGTEVICTAPLPDPLG